MPTHHKDCPYSPLECNSCKETFERVCKLPGTDWVACIQGNAWSIVRYHIMCSLRQCSLAHICWSDQMKEWKCMVGVTSYLLLFGFYWLTAIFWNSPRALSDALHWVWYLRRHHPCIRAWTALGRGMSIRGIWYTRVPAVVWKLSRRIRVNHLIYLHFLDPIFPLYCRIFAFATLSRDLTILLVTTLTGLPAFRHPLSICLHWLRVWERPSRHANAPFWSCLSPPTDDASVCISVHPHVYYRRGNETL